MKHRTSEWSAWGHRRAQHNWNLPSHLPGTVFKIILIPSTPFSRCCSLFVAFKSIFPPFFCKCLSAAGQGKSNFGQLRRSPVLKRVIGAGSEERWKEHPELLCGKPVTGPSGFLSGRPCCYRSLALSQAELKWLKETNLRRAGVGRSATTTMLSFHGW